MKNELTAMRIWRLDCLNWTMKNNWNSDFIQAKVVENSFKSLLVYYSILAKFVNFSYASISIQPFFRKFWSRKMLIHLFGHWMKSLGKWRQKIFKKNWTFKVCKKLGNNQTDVVYNNSSRSEPKYLFFYQIKARILSYTMIISILFKLVLNWWSYALKIWKARGTFYAVLVIPLSILNQKWIELISSLNC